MGNTLRDFYQDVEGAQIAEAPSSFAPAGVSPAESRKPVSSSGGNNNSGAMPAGGKGRALVPQAQPGKDDVAHRTIEAGKQYEAIATSHKSLTGLLEQAKSGSVDALRQIINDYGFDSDSLKITITEPLRDASGKEPDKYGIKIINSEEEWVAITRDWQTASAYFPEIELHNYATTRKGKRLAVVMGVSAKEFNAVIAAERRKSRLESEMRAFDRNIEQGRKDMGVDKMPRVPAGKNERPAPSQATPAQPKMAVAATPVLTKR